MSNLKYFFQSKANACCPTFSTFLFYNSIQFQFIFQSKKKKKTPKPKNYNNYTNNKNNYNNNNERFKPLFCLKCYTNVCFFLLFVYYNNFVLFLHINISESNYYRL